MSNLKKYGMNEMKMNKYVKLGLLSVLSLSLVACSDPPVDDSAKSTVIDGNAGMGGGMGGYGTNGSMSSGSLGAMDLNSLGALAALEDEKNYAVGGVEPTIYFGLDSFGVEGQGNSVVTHYAKYLNTNPKLIVSLEGHCDERGSSDYNMALGERRSKAVKDALVMAGVQASRIRTVSFGEEKPAAEGHDEVSWSKNRRVELKFPRQ
jgi:peptidoglycan-associated lipoprotein